MRQTLRKIVAVLALTGILASFVPSTFAAGETALSAADTLADMGVINSQENASGYNLAGLLLRQESVKIVLGVAGVDYDQDETCDDSSFSDVNEGWVCNVTTVALDAGLIADNATFRPKDFVSQFEALALALRANNIIAIDEDLTVAEVVAEAKAAGIIPESATINTKANASRGDMFKYMVEGWNYAQDQNLDPLCEALGLCADDTDGGTDGGTTTGGAVSVSAADAPFAPGTSLPVASGITVGRFTLTAAAETSVSAVRLWSRGVGARTDIAGVSLSANGVKLAKSKTISSEDLVDLNFIAPLVVKPGSPVTVDIVVSTASAVGEHQFVLDGNSITATGPVSGSFPIATPMFKTSTTSAGTLTFTTDGSLSDVKLGTVGATLAKFKVANDNVEDIMVKSMTFKKHSDSTAQDADVANLKLFLNGTEVATGSLVNKYVTFNLSNATILKNKSNQKFEIRGDAVGGAGKTVKFVIDSTTDVVASGSKFLYGANTSGTTTAPNAAVNITAGAVTLVKEDAQFDKVIANKKDVVLGKIKVTVNSGKDVELSTLKLTIDSTNDAPVGVAFAQIENVEIQNETSGLVYDLSYVSGTASKVYSNTDMGLFLKSGMTYTFAVRADTKVSATNGDYTVKIASATGGDMVMKEVLNDTTVADITPNAVSLKKVTVSSASLTVTQNALSPALNAVIGNSDVELINFNIKAGNVGDVKIRELKFADEAASTLNNTLVSGFKLYKQNGATWELVKEVGTSDLASEEVTARDINLVIKANETVKFALKTSIVKDTGNATKTIKVRLSGYTAENMDDGQTVYAPGVDGNSDGVIIAAQVGAVSARTVTVQSTGTATVATDVVDSTVSKDINILAKEDVLSPFIGAYKITATNEGVKVKDLTVTFDSDISSTLSDVVLYKADKTTEIDREAVTAAAVTFTDIPNYIVNEGTESLYIKVVTRAIGKNKAGAILTDKYITSLAIPTAEGASSGDPVTIATATTDTKLFSVLPVRVSAVTFVASNGGESVVAANALSSGVNQVIGIVAITADSTTNTSAA